MNKVFVLVYQTVKYGPFIVFTNPQKAVAFRRRYTAAQLPVSIAQTYRRDKGKPITSQPWSHLAIFQAWLRASIIVFGDQSVNQ